MIEAFPGDAVILPAEIADGWAGCALGRVAVPGHAGAGMRRWSSDPPISMRRPSGPACGSR
jgi:hypothetical protein